MASKPAHSKETVEKSKQLKFISRKLAEGISRGIMLESSEIAIYGHYCYVIQHTMKTDGNGSVWKTFPTSTLTIKMFQKKLREFLKEDGIVSSKRY